MAHHSSTRRRLLLGAASALIVLPARARADFLDALKEGFGAGMNSGTRGGDAAVRKRIDAQQRRLATAPEMEEASRKAEAYFRARRLGLDSNRFSRDALRADAKAYRAILRSLERRGKAKLTFLEAAELGRQLIPVLVRLDETWFHDEELLNGRVYIPANDVVRVEYRGLCLDQRLPAPGLGSRLRFLPLSSVSDEKTGKALQTIARISRKYVEGADIYRQGEAKAEMQALVWALRDMQAGIQPRLSDFQRRMLAEIAPEQFGGMGGWNGIGWRIGEAIGKDVRRSFGGLIDLSNMGAVRDRMEEINRGGQADGSSTGSPYSQPAPGLNAMSVGMAPLSAALVVANETPAPVTLDLLAHVAEADTNTQRILITGLSRGDNLWRTKEDEEILQALLEEGLKLGTKAYIDWFPDGVEWAGISPKSVAARKLVAAVPFIGNFISAAEFYSGYGWTEYFKPPEERKRLNQAELLLAAAGTIPGAGNLTRMFGDAVYPVLLKAGQLVDKSSVAMSAAGVGASMGPEIYEKAKAASGSANDPVMKLSEKQMEPIVRRAYQAVLEA